jgi:diadenosine tetraphosphatase ApaH/serine/threonine PP2A family protein phosphatase
VFVEEPSGRWGFLEPGEIDGTWRLDGRRTIVNVGSVGQPRDNDPRACYVLMDGPVLTFRRVEYNVEATARKILDNPELDDFNGYRLREGR